MLRRLGLLNMTLVAIANLLGTDEHCMGGRSSSKLTLFGVACSHCMPVILKQSWGMKFTSSTALFQVRTEVCAELLDAATAVTCQTCNCLTRFRPFPAHDSTFANQCSCDSLACHSAFTTPLVGDRHLSCLERVGISIRSADVPVYTSTVSVWAV